MTFRKISAAAPPAVVAPPAAGAPATAFRLNPNCFEAHLVAGSFGFVQRDYEKAIMNFKRALEIDPDAYWSMDMASQAYDAVGDSVAATPGG